MTVAAVAKFVGQSLTSASSYSTISSTPLSNRLYLAAFESDMATATVNQPTLTGYGLTWLPALSVTFEGGRQRLTVLYARGASPTATPLVFDLAGQTQNSARWAVDEVDGTDLTVSATATIVQALSATGTSQQNISVTLAGFGTGGAVAMFADSKSTGTGSTTGAPLAVIGNTANTFGRIISAFYEGTDLAPDITFAAANHVGAIALELKAATAGSSWLWQVDATGEAVDQPPVGGSSSLSNDPAIIRVRAADLSVVAEITDVASPDFVLRHQAVGSFVLSVPANSVAAPFLRAPGAGIILLRNGRTLFSGPVRRIQDSLAEQDGAMVSTLEVSGPDDTVILAESLASPEPATSGPPYDTDEYDVRTGPAESLMHGYVSDNAGPTAVAARIRAGLTLGVDGVHGATVTGRARWHTLLEVLQTLARQSVAAGGVDIGFRVVQTGESLTFLTEVPQDRRATARFSTEFGNLRGFTYEDVAPAATYVVTAGQGEGTARAVAETEDTAATARWAARIEQFKDRRDVPTGDELVAAAGEALLESQGKSRLTLDPVDTENLAFGVGYNVGDIVTVEIVIPSPEPPADGSYGAAGETYGDSFHGDTYADFGAPLVAVEATAVVVDVVREVRLSYSGENGETVQPLVGTDAGGGPLAGLYQRLAAVEADQRALKRR